MSFSLTTTMGRKWIEDFQLSGNAIMAMLGLKFSSTRYIAEDEFIVDYQTALYYLYEDDYQNHLDQFKDGLEELKKKRLYIELKDISKTAKVCKGSFFSSMELDAGWIRISLKNIRKVLSADGINSRNLLKLYIEMLLSRNGSYKLDPKFRYKIMTMPVNYYSKVLNLNERTISKYISVLCKLKLIVKAKPKHTDIGGNFLRNYYAAYSDVKLLEEYLKKEVSTSYQICYTEKEVDQQKEIISFANDSRKKLAKYIWLLKGKEYPSHEVYEIKKAVQNYNDRQMAVYQNCLKKGKPCELVQKDMSIFDKYDFSEYEQTKPEVIFDLDTFNPESSVGS